MRFKILLGILFFPGYFFQVSGCILMFVLIFIDPASGTPACEDVLTGSTSL
jgi:hypothetical protein